MSRILFFVLFIVIAFSLYFAMHLFVYKTLTKYLVLPVKSKTILKLFFLFSALSFPVANLLSRFLKIFFLNHYAYVWLGIMAISFTVLIFTRAGLLFFPHRAKIFMTVALSLIAIISIISLINGLRSPLLKKISIPLKNLPEKMYGFSIVQLSDLHFEEYKSLPAFNMIIKRVNSLKPDLVVITGDLIDGNIAEDSRFWHTLKKIESRYGVMAITGNHEFYSGIESFLKLAQLANIKVLRNEKITIANSLEIIGLDDNEARRFSQNGPNLDAGLKECDKTKPIILLYHRPEGFEKAVKKGVGLQLSGHTHAGQIPPMDLLVWFFLKYPYGLYEKDGSYIYTSCGTGYWGPPMRFFTRAEIVQFSLVPIEKGL